MTAQEIKFTNLYLLDICKNVKIDPAITISEQDIAHNGYIDIYHKHFSEVEIIEEKRTFAIDSELLAKMEMESYWQRLTHKEIIHLALTQYFSNKDLKPVPATFKKNKRGPKPK